MREHEQNEGPPAEATATEGQTPEASTDHSQPDVESQTDSAPTDTEEDADEERPPLYEWSRRGLIWNKRNRDGEPVPTPLTNFIARITADVSLDDGVDTQHFVELEAGLNGKARRFTIPTSIFSTMNWPMEYLGPSAVVYPGYTKREHARAAIQMLSGEVPGRTVYTHTGWRKIGDKWAYLHGGGAIGPDGSVEDIEVRLHGSLERAELPDPPSGEALVEAVRASLRILEVAPDRITVPVLAAVFRAPLGECDQSLYVAGRTGVGKSEIAALAQQHYGPGFDRSHLPGAWSSTDNSLEVLAFTAKDMLLVVDDFCPTGSQYDVARWHQKADRVLRAQGNQSGRGRLRSDSTLQPTKPPRGIILSTGEDTPRGQSLRARLTAIDVGPDDVDWDALTRSQADAADGKLAQVMSGYVEWLAPRFDGIRGDFSKEIAELREEATKDGQHKRTPTTTANLAIGLRHFLDFAQELGAIDADEKSELWARFWKALGEVAEEQGGHLTASEPTDRFLELFSSAISSGKAHLAGPDGEAPKKKGELPYPLGWGWRQQDRQEPLGVGCKPSGDRVGWVDGEDVYLDPTAAFQAAQRMVGPGGDGLTVNEQTLRKRLNEKGLLASKDSGRLTVRKMLEGKRRSVLHLKTEALDK